MCINDGFRFQVASTSLTPKADFIPEACRTRNELYHYTNYAEDPSSQGALAQSQCWDIANFIKGSMCNINGAPFGTPTQGGGRESIEDTSQLY